MQEALRPSSPQRVRAALDAAASRGMFFAWGDPAGDPDGWQAVGGLYAPGSAALGSVIEDVRLTLGGCEPRVAASVFFQGYAARLVSPPLACIAMTGLLPAMPADQVCWRRQQGTMMTLGMPVGQGSEGPAGLLIAELVKSSFEEHLLPLREAVMSRVKIAEAVLTGNAASALVAGIGLLREQFGPAWQVLAAEAVRHRYLLGCGSFAAPGLFVRRSCCLIYRVPPGATCGDCPISGRNPDLA